MRITIGDVGKWSIAKAEAEARRLQVEIDKGDDPRQVKAHDKAAKEAAAAAKVAEALALAQAQARDTVTVSEAWQAYIAERTASIVDGKPEWGEKHKAHPSRFFHAWLVTPPNRTD